MLWLFLAVGAFVVLLIIIGVFIMFQRSKGTVVEEPSHYDDGELDYDGLEDKEFLCRNCGEPIDPFDDECGNCGMQFEMEFECQFCGEMIDDPRELVCPHCGEALMNEVTVCPQCTAIVPNEAQHCDVCGSDFWSPIFLQPRQKPKFQPPPEREYEEGEEGDEQPEEEE